MNFQNRGWTGKTLSHQWRILGSQNPGTELGTYSVLAHNVPAWFSQLGQSRDSFNVRLCYFEDFLPFKCNKNAWNVPERNHYFRLQENHCFKLQLPSSTCSLSHRRGYCMQVFKSVKNLLMEEPCLKLLRNSGLIWNTLVHRLNNLTAENTSFLSE